MGISNTIISRGDRDWNAFWMAGSRKSQRRHLISFVKMLSLLSPRGRGKDNAGILSAAPSHGGEYADPDD